MNDRNSKTGRPIRVVVVDDSALMRQLLTVMLNRDPGIEVVGAATDPLVAREMIKHKNPDVITLDIEMPKMDGLTFLERIMKLRPMPVIMVSSLTQEGADATLQALETGAVDFVAKPRVDLQTGLAAKRDEIIAKVRMAAGARVRGRRRESAASRPARMARRPYSSTEKLIAIGASVGGVEALREVICNLPADSPAVLVTQHLPEKFTASFARRLDATSQISVCEATDGQRVLPGHAYIAPGNHHMELARSGANYLTRLNDEARVSGHKPSVDVLFRSVAKAAGANAVGAILTGMGRDGAEGLAEMHRAGAMTFGQEENSCVVYGMPKAAMELGAVDRELPLSQIADAVLDATLMNEKRQIRV